MITGSHALVVVHPDELEWEDDTDLFTLPKGIKIKIFCHDPATGRRDGFVRFPAGYIEPSHRHHGWHSNIIIEGEMHVDGHVLKAGDYLFGPGDNIAHGPLSYPKGCVVFFSFHGPTEHDH
jgi:hypothetical protein